MICSKNCTSSLVSLFWRLESRSNFRSYLSGMSEPVDGFPVTLSFNPSGSELAWGESGVHVPGAFGQAACHAVQLGPVSFEFYRIAARVYARLVISS